MTTVRIARVVKYNGVVYPANVDIPVDDNDVKDLLKRGGWVINKEAPAAQPAPAAENEDGAAVGDTGNEGSGAATPEGGAASDTDGDAGASADADANSGNGEAEAGAGEDGAAADELAELREYAEALGVEVKKNWGIAKLKKEIAAAESK